MSVVDTKSYTHQQGNSQQQTAQRGTLPPIAAAVLQVEGSQKEMIGVQQQSFTLLLLALEPNTPYIRYIYTQNGTYDPIIVSTPAEAQKILQSYTVDAIITNDAFESLQFITTYHRHHERDHRRPVLCVLSQSETLPPDTTAADIVLPPLHPSYIDRQIRTYLTSREDLFTLEKRQDEVTLLKNAIVRNVSHELKTPLLQVKAAVALLAEDQNADEALSNMAVMATARLETVVKNITLLADGLNGVFGPVQLSESVDQAIRNLRRNWLHKDAISRIKTHYEADLPLVLADKQGLGVVLQQLIDNALKFSKDEVVVSATTCDDGIRITVRDYGIGIAEDKHKQIFESFYQVDSSATRRYGGTGVGLAIVRLILEKHDADIEVESKLNEGSAFSFKLPEAEL